MRKLVFIALFSLSCSVYAQEFKLHLIDSKTNASFRGLSVVDKDVAWVSGSSGWVGISTHAGNDWSFMQVPGYETSDFRSIYAINETTAIIANAGSPAYVLRTADSGKTWKLVYKNDKKEVFIDGIDFWNPYEGIIYGDPMDGRMMILRTADSGVNWNEVAEETRPELEPGEASFAASGTTIRCLSYGRVMIATGGEHSRLWVSADKGFSWINMKTPILQESASTGIFSLTTAKPNSIFIVGGDYKRDTLSLRNSYFSPDGGASWRAPVHSTRGYRECIEVIDKKQQTLIAVGPTGIDISLNKGLDWAGLYNEKSFHVVRRSRKGKLIVLAGGDGRIATLTKRKA